MFIPLRTNRPARRRPLVTEALILLTMVVYLAGLLAEFTGTFDRWALLERGHLVGHGFRAWQLVTYQFLHDPGSLWHLAFNMLFLWVFGCAVEDRLGRFNFLAFYLIGGAVAGVAHMIIEPATPVIGASGSIAAVTGAFLALFPRSRITLLVFFFYVGVFEIPALWFIGFYFVVDVLRQTMSILGGPTERVAYAAHIAGSLYGFALSFALLATGIVKREEFDVFFLFRQARRRAAFRTANRDPARTSWESAPADTGKRLAARAKKAHPPTAPTEEEERQARARAEISGLLEAHDLPGAAVRYRGLLEEAPRAVFSEHRQLDLANQLQKQGDHPSAARAYELLLEAYPGSPHAPEVRLILGLLYARYLDRAARALELLSTAKAKLTDPGQRALADQILGELGA